VRCHKNRWIYLTSTYYWWLLRPTITIRFDSKWKKHYLHSTSLHALKRRWRLYVLHLCPCYHPCVSQSMHPSVRDYMLYVSTISPASIDGFLPNICHWCVLGQRWTDYVYGFGVKGQGHIYAAKASSTWRCRWVKLSSSSIWILTFWHKHLKQSLTQFYSIDESIISLVKISLILLRYHVNNVQDAGTVS